jgi:Domain of Unknown Function (DUF1206)
MQGDVGIDQGLRSVRGEAARTANSPWFERLARAGMAAKGAIFGIIGVLAVEVAIGAGGKTTNQQGALRTLSDESYGTPLLIVLAIGLAGYALWRFAQAALDREAKGDGAKGVGTRIGYAVSGAVYGALCYSAVTIILGSSSSSSGGAKKPTADVLGVTGGREIVIALGLILIGVGLYNGWQGIKQSFMKKMKRHEMRPAEQRWVARIGSFGLLARMVVFGIIGVFAIEAAVTYDPQKAVGLDGALQRLAGHAYGAFLLGVVAAGLVAYGVYCVAQARYRRV